MSHDFEAALDDIDSPRRAFLNRLVTDSAFTEPAVASFTMSGLSRAYAGILASSNLSG